MKPIQLSLMSLTLLACSNNFEKGGSEITSTEEPSNEDTDVTQPSSEPDDTDTNVDPDDVDNDSDGFTENQGDCDDTNSQVNPNGQDRSIDGIDQNCDGLDGPDHDEDGYVDMAAGGTDCNDNNPNVNPGQAEDISDGIDTDCDGEGDPGFYALTDEVVDEFCYGSCDRVAVTVDSYRQAHVVYEYNSEIWYNSRTTQGTWSGYTMVAEPTTDTVVACEDTCGVDAGYNWVGDGYCDDGGPNSDYSVCDFGTDCSDCGERISSGDTRELGVAGMDAKVDALDRVQVAYTEEGAGFTALQYIFKDASGNWTEPVEIDGPGNNRYNVGRDVAMDIDSNNMPTFVYYNGESGVPYVYDMTNPLVSTLTSLSGINMPLDIEIPELDAGQISGGTLSGVYGGYSGLYNTVVIDANNDAHAIFYNHNEIQNQLNYWGNNPLTSWAVGPAISYINNLFNLDLISNGPGSLNQYTALSATDAFNSLSGGNYCFNSDVKASQNLYNSAALRSDGSVCLAYFDNTTRQVKYSCNTGTCEGWSEEVVASVNVGASSLSADAWSDLNNRDLVPKDRVRLAFTTKDAPYVVYHDATNNTVNIALKENGQWNSYPVGNGGAQLDVDIDQANYIHIAYIDNTGSVRYVLGQ